MLSIKFSMHCICRTREVANIKRRLGWKDRCSHIFTTIHCWEQSDYQAEPLDGDKYFEALVINAKFSVGLN